MKPEQLRSLAAELIPICPWAVGSIQAAAKRIEELEAELRAARQVVEAGRELRAESPCFYGNLKAALTAYDAAVKEKKT